MVAAKTVRCACALLIAGWSIPALAAETGPRGHVPATEETSPGHTSVINTSTDRRLIIGRGAKNNHTVQVFRGGIPRPGLPLFTAASLSPVITLLEGSDQSGCGVTDLATGPFPCDADGQPAASGAFMGYELALFHYQGQQQKRMVRDVARVVVEKIDTFEARIAKVVHTQGPEVVLTEAGRPLELNGWDPTLAPDGRLIIFQGGFSGPGLHYASLPSNAGPAAARGWSEPAPLTAMHADARVNTRYPLAKEPLRAATGRSFRQGEIFPGGYAWYCPEREILYFCAVSETDAGGPIRRAWSVIGEATHHRVQPLDGSLNLDRLPYAPDGVFLGMLPEGVFRGIPAAPFKESCPIITSNTRRGGLTYVEVSHDEGDDPDYLAILHLRESVDHFRFVPGLTPDAASAQRVGRLLGGARFEPVNAGRLGQGLTLEGRKARVEMDLTSPENDELTVELFVRPLSAGRLLHIPGQIEIRRQQGGRIAFAAQTAQGTREGSGGLAPAGEWTHIALVCAPGSAALFIDGTKAADQTFPKFTLSAGRGLVLGGDGFQGRLDEVKVSRRARTPFEIARSAGLMGANSGVAPRVRIERQGSVVLVEISDVDGDIDLERLSARMNRTDITARLKEALQPIDRNTQRARLSIPQVRSDAERIDPRQDLGRAGLTIRVEVADLKGNRAADSLQVIEPSSRSVAR